MEIPKLNEEGVLSPFSYRAAAGIYGFCLAMGVIVKLVCWVEGTAGGGWLVVA